jgi:ornithine cyclodeaminase
MVGAGAMAPYLIRAHSALRPIEEVRIWNRSAARAEALADQLRGEGVQASPASDLQSAVETADIVSCATVSSEPLVRGAWLKPGTHLDLVGAFRPDLRESDDEAVRRAAVYADTRAGVLAEGGDIIQPVKAGVIEESDILGDLHDLTAGRIAGRRDADQITLFKSVGTALEDLVAARYLYALKQAAG